jgi:predicted ATPase/DNA-binding SARP family transcriptional activator
MPEERARANLRLTLNKLRQAVGDYLIPTRDFIAFNSNQPYWLDLAEFEVQAAVPEQSDNKQLLAALDLYRGDFLDDFYIQDAPDFETWVLSERERLRLIALRALSHLATEARQRNDFEASVQATRRILSLEPWHEEAHRQLMWLLARSGQRSAALAQFNVCRRTLADELGVEPAQETVALYDQIRAGEQGIEDNRLLRPSIHHPLATSHVSPLPSHNLPAQLTPFVGRESELAEIADLLARPACRLLTLVGPGGIGKTRLALAAAEAQLQAFQNNITFVSLVGVMPIRENEATDLLIANIANALHYTFSAQQPPYDLLLNYLADKKMLLLLDNFELLGTAAKLLIDILQHAPDIKLLVTSRERLGIEAEWLFDVTGLPYPPTLARNAQADYSAVRLFIQSAQRIKPDFAPEIEERDVNRICQLVEGSPLGLELAANWVRLLSCNEIVARLERNLDMLAATTPGIADRHRSMRVVLDYSWNLLSDEEQQVFRRLSVFQEGFELKAAEEVAGASLPALAGLVDKSWLGREDSRRYRVHELVRQYGAEQLATHPTEQAAAQQKHGCYYAEFLEARRGPLEEHADQSSLAEIDKEVENIRAAWEWLLAHGRVEAIAAYLEALWRYYQHKGWFQEAVFALNQACALEQASTLQKVRWQRWLGNAHFQMGHLQESRQHLEQVQSLLGWPLPTTRIGWSLLLLRQILRQMMHRLWPTGSMERSTDKQSRLIEGARAMVRLGQIYFFAEDKLPFLTNGIYSLNMAERARSVADVAVAYSGISLTCANIHLPRLAGHYNRLAHETVPHVNNLPLKAFTLELLGVYYLGNGQWTKAQETLEQAADLADHLGLQRFWEESLLTLAIAAYHRGEFAKSMSRFAEVLASADYRGDPLVQHWALLGETQCALQLGHGQVDKVMFLLERAKALPEQYLGVADVMRGHGVLAQAYLYQGQPELARQAAQAAARLVKQVSFMMFWTMDAYAGPAKVFLALWETETILGLPNLKNPKSYNPAKSECEASLWDKIQNLKSEARQACRAMHAFAQIFLFAQPRAWLYQGLYDWLAGKPVEAHRAWRKSYAAAERLSMPYEQGQAHYEIGRHLLPQQKTEEGLSRENHLQRACQIFANLEAAYNLAQAEAALEEPART